ncbi:phosphatases II [Paxillus ammoniavirescens]|nr:phosphatases II [Paxillus ammoniavirescens]
MAMPYFFVHWNVAVLPACLAPATPEHQGEFTKLTTSTWLGQEPSSTELLKAHNQFRGRHNSSPRKQPLPRIPTSPPTIMTQVQIPTITIGHYGTPQRRSSLAPICTDCPRPIPNSYWATPQLLACEYPWSPYEVGSCQKLDKLLASGVRTFIDLTECGELSPYSPHLPSLVSAQGIDITEIEYHQFPIQDRSLPESKEFMFQILNVLRDNEKRGRVTAVHCRGGIGRTGMVIGCWLVESETAKSGEDALGMIARLWKTVEKCKRYPHSPETGPQVEFVKNFEPARPVSA